MEEESNFPTPFSSRKLQLFLLTFQPFRPYLVVAGIVLVFILVLLFYVPPELVADWLLPQSYVPFYLPFFIFATCLFAFFSRSLRRGSMASLFIVGILVLLQRDVFVWWQLLLGLVILVGTDSLLTRR